MFAKMQPTLVKLEGKLGVLSFSDLNNNKQIIQFHSNLIQDCIENHPLDNHYAE